MTNTITKERRDAIRAAAKMGEPVAWTSAFTVKHCNHAALDSAVGVLRTGLASGSYQSALWSAIVDYLERAAPPAVEPVKVKPLEWKKAFWGGKQAQTFYGRYSVGRNTWSATGFEMRDPDCADSDTLATGEYYTEQDAMDAAQALHEANIRSALASAEPVIPEGWVLVPRKPTEAMKDAVRQIAGVQALAYGLAAWDTMLAAAPALVSEKEAE